MDPLDLRIGLAQIDIVWEQPAVNRRLLTTLVERTDGEVHLMLLPEMFTTGFTMRPQPLAEPMDGPTAQWMLALAERKGLALGGSVIIREGDACYNRFLLAMPGGRLAHYDKRHLFTMGGEHRHYAPGLRRTIIEHRGWRLLPQVCYDIRFPVWSRNRNDYDAIIYVANFPAQRQHVWNTLLRARAIENQCYAIGVNRVGADPNGTTYQGGSQAVNPWGRRLTAAPGSDDQLRIHCLSLTALRQYREEFPVLGDADAFTLLL